MFKAIFNFANQFSIKTQVATIAISSIFVIIWLGVVALNTENEMQALTHDLSETTNSLQMLSDASLQMRRHEKEYFQQLTAHHIASYVASADKASFYATQLLAENNPQTKAQLKQIQQAILDHKTHFITTTKIKQTLGTAPDNGLKGELRAAIHSIEVLLDQLKKNTVNQSEINSIIVEMLMLRRHEKDFMLRGNQLYLNKFKNQINVFKAITQNSFLQPSDKQTIYTRLDIYNQKFQAWGRKKSQLETARAKSSDIYNVFSPLINQLIQNNKLSGVIAENSRLSEQQLSKVFLIVSIAIIASLIIAIGIMILLFRQHEKFKNIVEQKTTLVEQANELEKMNVENIQLANVDTLTTLPNRRSFFSQLETLTEQYKQRPNKKFVVGLLDLDGFKRINDVFGHPTGDDLLKKSAQRLQDVVGKNIILSRLGGDEFGFIITDPEDIEHVLKLGRAICAAMRHAFHLKEGSVQIGATIGFVEFPSMASSSQLLFERADYALYYSKQHSKGEPVLFSEEHESIIRNASNIELQLREANLEDELSIMFQPIVDIQSQRTMGFEALARWNNASLGVVPPDVFIKAAEQMGVIGRLTTILLRKALNAAIDWPEHAYLSFNLSIYDLSSPQTILSLISIVEKSSFPSKRIVFEITETAVMNDFKQANEALNLLKLQGAQIALDDFGTGYSSLSYVQRMPLDRLKIDRSFINDITTDKNTRNIVQTIVDLCNNLELYCIVEGIETKEQLTVVQNIGCRYIQGYYFSRPLSPEDAVTFIHHEDLIPKRLAS